MTVAHLITGDGRRALVNAFEDEPFVTPLQAFHLCALLIGEEMPDERSLTDTCWFEVAEEINNLHGGTRDGYLVNDEDRLEIISDCLIGSPVPIVSREFWLTADSIFHHRLLDGDMLLVRESLLRFFIDKHAGPLYDEPSEIIDVIAVRRDLRAAMDSVKGFIIGNGAKRHIVFHDYIPHGAHEFQRKMEFFDRRGEAKRHADETDGLTIPTWIYAVVNLGLGIEVLTPIEYGFMYDGEANDGNQ
jgi:hypothetical protein